jgi:hypothetical protein
VKGLLDNPPLGRNPEERVRDQYPRSSSASSNGKRASAENSAAFRGTHGRSARDHSGSSRATAQAQCRRECSDLGENVHVKGRPGSVPKQRERSSMRPSELALVLTFIAVAGCDDRQLEEQLNQSRAALTEERERRAAAELRAGQAEALVAEMQARGYPLAEFTLRIGIRTRLLGEPPPSSIRRLATVAQLELSDGQVWNLIDLNTDGSPMRAADDGTYNLEFTYQPQDPRSVLGRDVSELARIRTLRLRYGAILNSVNLDPNFELSYLSVTANGLPIVDATGLGVTSSTDSSAFQAFDVANHFGASPERYAQALRERARTRQSQSPDRADSATAN